MEETKRTRKELLRENELLKERIKILETSNSPRQNKSGISCRDEDFMRLFDNLPLMAVFVDKDFRYQYVNKKFSNFFGLSPHEIIGQKTSKLIGIKLFKELKPAALRVFEGASETVETSITIGSEQHLFNIYTSPWFNTSGSIDGLLAIFEEITEQKQQERKLFDTKEIYKTLLDNIEENAFLTDRSGKALVANRSVIEGNEVTEEEYIGSNIYEYLDEKTAERRKKYVSRAFRTKEPVEFEDSTNGRYFHHRIYPVLNDKGRAEFAAIITINITDLKNEEMELRRTRQDLKALIDSSFDAMFLIELDGTVVLANKALTDKLDVSDEEIRGEHINRFSDPKRAEFRKAKSIEAAQKRKPITFYDEDKDNILFVTLSPVFDEKGKIRHIAGYSRNVTREVKAERALRESEEQFRMLAEHANDVIFMADPELNIQYVNPAIENITGYTPEEFIKLPAKKGVEPEDYKRIKHALKNKKKISSVYDEIDNFTLSMTTKDGRTVWLEENVRVLRNEDGSVKGFLGIARDITSRKQEDEKIQKSEEFLRLVLSSVSDGAWDWNIKNNTSYRSESWYKNLGLVHEDKPSKDTWVKLLHPDDKEETLRRIDEHLDGEADEFRAEFRLKTGSGKYKWFLGRGRIVERDKKDRPLRMVGTDVDLSYRKEMEEELKKANQMLSNILENSNAAIYVFDTDNRLILANNAAKQIVNVNSYKPGESILKYIPDDLKSLFISDNENIISVKEKISSEIKTNINGKEFYLLSLRFPLIDDNDEVYAICGMAFDLTEQKKIENEIARQRELYYTLFDSMAEAVFIFDTEGNVIDFNKSVLDLYKAEPDSLKSYNLFTDPEIIMDENLNKIRLTDHPVAKAIKNAEKLHNAVVASENTDGTIKWRSMNVEPVPVPEGEKKLVIVSDSDITGLKASHIKETQLRKNIQALLSLMQKKDATRKTISDGFLEEIQKLTESPYAFLGFINDPETEMKIHSWSGMAMKDCMTEKVRLFKVYENSLWAESVRQRKSIIINDYPETERPKRGLPNGHVVIHRFLTVPIFRKNKIIALAAVANKKTNYTDENLRDIEILAANYQILLEKLDYENELLKAKETAEKADKAKSRFIANMSHELRTPLNGIMGFAQLIKRNKDLDESTREGVDIIWNSGNHLLNLINDILDFSQLESERLPLVYSNFSVTTLIEDIVKIVKREADRKLLDLEYHIDDKIPGVVKGDQKRIKQVMLNLLSNAIKFTKSGGSIEIKVENKEKEIRFSVKDTGIGISKKDQEKIFRPFSQIQNTNNGSGGTGLGLAICKSLVELMGGTLELNSKEGEGSDFYFDLSLPEVKGRAIDTIENEDSVTGYLGRKRKILVVDDNYANVLVLQDFLEDLGFEVLTTENGEDAIKLAKESLPDLIVMDLVLPGLSGLRCIEILRTVKALQNTRIITVSANTQPGIEQKCIDAGSNAYLGKPFQLRELITKIGEQLKLDWTYGSDKNKPAVLFESNKEKADFIMPSRSEYPEIYTAALSGNINLLRTLVSDLEQSDEKYIAFAKKLYNLINGFQIISIRSLFRSEGEK